MPYQCTERKTRSASAEVVDRSAVGPCSPGRMPTRLAQTTKIQSEPTNGSTTRAYSGITASMAFSIAPTTPSSATCQDPGSSLSRRAESQQTISRLSITAQVVTTVSLIGSGPILKSTFSNGSLAMSFAQKKIDVNRTDNDAQHDQAHRPMNFISGRQAVEPLAEIGASDHRQDKHEPERAQINGLAEQRAFLSLGLLHPPRLFLHLLFEPSRGPIVRRGRHPEASPLLPIFHNRLNISSSSRRMLCFTSRKASSSTRSSRRRAALKLS